MTADYNPTDPGLVIDVLDSSRLPFVVRWPDGGVVAYRADELRVLAGLEKP